MSSGVKLSLSDIAVLPCVNWVDHKLYDDCCFDRFYVSATLPVPACVLAKSDVGVHSFYQREGAVAALVIH
jgi:hypothetical protein